MKTVNEFIEYAKNALHDLYEAQELQQIVFLLLEEVMGFSRTDLQLRRMDPLDDKDTKRLHGFVRQLKEGRPLQYVLGFAWFHGLKLKVNESVLIPRPETEELADWIISDLSRLPAPVTVLDIGTGSGCIPIAISKALPAAQVHAIDISESALMVAKENAARSGVVVDFFQGDILSADFREAMEKKFDVIVSNPPYIRKTEMASMAPTVTEFEPHLALFVDDSDPLIFYRAIASFARKKLNAHGSLYVEINEALGIQVAELLTSIGFREVKLKKDLSGKDRMVRASN